MRPLGGQTANAVYDVLVEECAAPESRRGHFVHNQTREVIFEWRFQGALDFGGKFWRDGTGLGPQFRVDCYPEDVTPQRMEMIRRANERLAEPCEGSDRCTALMHVHGCYADLDGTACDDPEDHQHQKEIP